jgi:hypothetical protein
LRRSIRAAAILAWRTFAGRAGPDRHRVADLLEIGPARQFGGSLPGHPAVAFADRLQLRAHAGLSLRCTVGRDMNEQDDKLGVHEELQEADLIPDAFPEQDPKVDREWEKAKEDPMGGESPSS